MDKQTKNLLTIGAVFLVIWYIGGGQVPGLGPQAVVGDGDQAVGDGRIDISVGTPTLEWFVTDKLSGRGVEPGHFRVTVNGATKDYLSSDTINISKGDGYTVCLMPNSTYYGKCETGTVIKTVTKVNIEAYHLASTPTVYINNDVENATLRNSAAAPDNITDDEAMQPTICIQGNGALQAFGPDGILFLMDWNTHSADAVSFSVGTEVNIIPRGHDFDVNENTASSWEITGPLLNGQTICGVLTYDGEATAGSAAEFASSGSPDFTIYDKHLSRNSATDLLEYKYMREIDGTDTNSVTNATATYFLTS